MKKYKVLLAGKNNTAFDDFFKRLRDNFDSMTTSGRYEDIVNHLKYCEPDIFVYCMNYENSEDISKVISVREQLKKYNVPFVAVGSEDDCSSLTQYAASAVDLLLIKPISANSIAGRIMEYLEEQQRLREDAERAKAERLEKEEKEHMEEEERKRLEQEEKEKPVQDADSPKKHVLVVDDDPLMLKAIKEHLRDKYDVATAHSGKIALKFLEKKKTNLILLDYAMPAEDGPMVLEKLHANDATRDIPVIFLTGITERGKIEKALAQKPQGYLLKPVDHDKLIESIERIIG